jgi:hypothetical protein
MPVNEVVLPGSVTVDGLLELKQPVPLPAGPVEVTIKVLGHASEDTWTVLERIWAESKALGLHSRTAEQIDADLNALRAEAEEEVQELERHEPQANSLGKCPPC